MILIFNITESFLQDHQNKINKLIVCVDFLFNVGLTLAVSSTSIIFLASSVPLVAETLLIKNKGINIKSHFGKIIFFLTK